MAAPQTSPRDPRDPGVLQETTPQERRDAASGAKHASGFSAGLGIWLLLAPFVLTYVTPAAFWNDIVVGVLALALGAIRYANPRENAWASWTIAGLGAWLVLAPYVLAPYDFSGKWNDIAVGALLVLTGFAGALGASRMRRGR